MKFLYKREFALLVPSWVRDDEMLKRSTRMLRAHNAQQLLYLINKGLRMFRGLFINNEQFKKMFSNTEQSFSVVEGGGADGASFHEKSFINNEHLNKTFINNEHRHFVVEKSTPYNFYYSLARYTEGIPMQTMNFSLRDNSGWQKTHTHSMQDYDFLLDIDAGSHDDIMMAHYSARLISDLFDEKNIPYELRFSGKGFHIIIPSGYFPSHSYNPKAEDSIYRLYAKIAKFLENNYSEMIDSGIYDSRRICKVPYSWALYEDAEYLCIPFIDKKDFLDFELKQYQFLDKLGSMPDCFNVRGRGTKVFNSSGTVEPLLEMI
jgi:hypothetical protein